MTSHTPAPPAPSTVGARASEILALIKGIEELL